MTALTEAPNDEHLARVMLAYASEPGIVSLDGW